MTRSSPALGHGSSLTQRRDFRSRRGRQLPRNGNVLPQKKFSPGDVAKGQSEVLHGVYGRLASPAKEMALDTGDSERACRNRIAGVNCYSLTDFFNAANNVPELQEWGAMMMGLKKSDPEAFNREMSKGLGGIITIRVEGAGVKVEGG